MALRKEWVDEKEIKQLKAVSLEAEIERKKERAKTKAITNLGRYKFMNFGYWAAVWIHLNQLSGKKTPNPFKDFVDLARLKMTYEKYQEDREGKFENDCKEAGRRLRQEAKEQQTTKGENE